MDCVTTMVADDKSVVIFTKNGCCMSHSITALIRSFGANPTAYELDATPNRKEIEKALMEMGCRPSVPAVFIGGAKEVMSLHLRAELSRLLN